MNDQGSHEVLTCSSIDLEEALIDEIQERVKAGAVPGLVFAPTYVEGEEMAHQLSQRLSIRVPFVSGKMPRGQRAQIAETMRTSPGLCPVAVATTVWATGLDIPGLRWVAPMEGSAPIRLLQTRGRSMRPKGDGATYEVLEVVKRDSPNSQEHAEKRDAHYAEAGFDTPKDLLHRSEERWKDRPRARRRRAAAPSPPPLQQLSTVNTRLQLTPQVPHTRSLLRDICGPPDKEETPGLYLLWVIVAIVAFCASLGELLK